MVRQHIAWQRWSGKIRRTSLGYKCSWICRRYCHRGVVWGSAKIYPTIYPFYAALIKILFKNEQYKYKHRQTSDLTMKYANPFFPWLFKKIIPINFDTVPWTQRKITRTISNFMFKSKKRFADEKEIIYLTILG